MNRLTALTIKARHWMSPNDYQSEVIKYGAQYSAGICPQIGYQTVWCESYDRDCIKMLLTNEDPATILNGFKAYYDNGTEEVQIYSKATKFIKGTGEVLEFEENYTQYLEHINDWYLERLGTYDPIIEDELI